MGFISSLLFSIAGVAVWRIFEEEGLTPEGPIGLLILVGLAVLAAAYFRSPPQN